MSLTPNQIYSTAIAQGFSPPDAVIMTAIALAESSGDPGITSKPNTNGTVDRGLFQINSVHSQYDAGRLTSDAGYNTKAAFELSGGGKNFKPWTTYNSGAYKKFMGQAQNAAQGGSGAAVGVTDTGETTGTEEAAPEMGPGERLNSMMDVVGGTAPALMDTNAPTVFPGGAAPLLSGDQSKPEPTDTDGGVDTSGVSTGAGSGPASGAIASALTAAKNKTPYVWGGNDLGGGVDCSGLIQQAYKSVGINLPRVSNAIIAAGVKVPVEQMQPGDILGWTYNNSLGGGATHVAMYIGGGMMVEALHKGEPVHVVPVRAPHVVSRPVGDKSGGAAVAQPIQGRTTDTQPQNDPNDGPWGRLAAMANAIGAMGGGTL